MALMENEGIGCWVGWLRPVERLERSIRRGRSRELSGEEKRTVSRAVAKLRRLEEVNRRLRDSWPDLFAGQFDVRLSDDEVERLVTEVCQSDSGMEIRDAQRHLVTGLSRGVKELGWDVAVPAPYTSVSVLPSLFSTETAERLARFDMVQDRYLEWLQGTTSDGPRDIRIDAGELLFSFAFHTGVACHGWFSELSQAIGKDLETYRGTYWVTLEKSSGAGKAGLGDKKRRRIILAPMTALLLRRWHRHWSGRWPQEDTSEESLHVFTQHIGLASLTVRECQALSESNLTTVVPGFLVHYARTLDLGKSLRRENWARWLTGQFHQTQSDVAAGDSDAPSAYVPIENDVPPSETPATDQVQYFCDLAKWMSKFVSLSEKISVLADYDRRRLVAEFRHRTRKDIQRVFRQEGVSALSRMLAEYSLFLIGSDGALDTDLVRQAKHYHHLQRLLDYSPDVLSASTLDADEWQAIYDAILEVSPGDAGAIQAALSSWHEFLHTAYGLERVPSEVSDGGGVDAAILTETEFDIAKQQLLAAGGDYARMQLALLILGFRCGLRRSEAWSRRFEDFPGLGVEGVQQPELLVRPTKTVGVKSASAVRRLPLAILLPEDEQRWLAEFILDRQRRLPTNNRAAPVFADPVSGDFRITEPLVFSDLTLLLRQVSGDDSFRFHHLRHSFASFNLIRLLELSDGQLLSSEGSPQFVSDADAHEGGSEPLWRRAGLGDPSMSLALLSQWLGHSSERVTLRSYAHVLDFLLGQYLIARENPVLTLAQQQVILEKSPAALEKFRHRKRLTDRASTAADLLSCVRIRGARPIEEKGKTYPTEFDIQTAPRKTRHLNPLLPYRLALLVDQYSSRTSEASVGEALAHAASQLDIDQPLAEAWQARASALFNLPMPKADKLGRFSLNAPRSDVARVNFSLIFRAPELSNFPVPPQSRTAFQEMMGWFVQLADWAERDALAARDSLRLTAEAIQRSRPNIQPRGRERQLAFLKLILELRLVRHFEPIIHTTDANWPAAQQFWAQNSGLPKTRFRQELGVLKDPPKDGILHLKLKSPGKAGSYFWAALRFLVFTGCVMFDAVPGNADSQVAGS
ncbi:site-specific integrase [Marinobacter sp. LQ44]|uniref:site-specific integrase n=1 Tax=unclassified Marinobacter TaxID=83889 RepID=UPI000718DB74|nr:site-specific integrase [Marinobacter sp. LQ44]AMQ89616.1 hypothetical protein ASQ50_13410 [Marinobacter sp. LQ44]